MAGAGVESNGPKAFGKWLSGRLRGRHWSGADFARAMGTHPGNVSRWLRGEVRPSTTTIELMADIFREDVDMLLTLAGHRPVIHPLAANDPRRELHGMLDRVDLSAERIATLRGLLEDFGRRPLRSAAPPAPAQSKSQLETVT